MGHQDEADETVALRRAADVGWTDVEAGRDDDVDDGSRDDFIGQLGRRATPQADS